MRVTAMLVFIVLQLPMVADAEDTVNAGESESADGRRTLARYPENILRGLGGVFRKESLKPLLVGLAATGLSSSMDHEVRERVMDENDDAADFAADNLGPVGLGLVTLGLFVGGQYSENARFRAMSYDLGVVFVVNLGYTGVLKALAGRERPDGSDDASFPSGHTSNAFALASVASAHYGPTVGIPVYGLASLVGLSRIRSNAHWLSDVVAGASLGYLVGQAVVRQNSAPLQVNLLGGNTIDIAPAVSPDFRGVLMGMNF